MDWRRNKPLLTLIIVSLLLGAWWLFFGDDPEKLGGADVDYPMGTYEALFAKTYIVPGLPLKRRDFEMRVVRGGSGNGDIIGSVWQIKDRVCKTLKMPGERIVLADLVPVMRKAVCTSRKVKGGEPLTKDDLKLVDRDVVWILYDTPDSFEPILGKVFRWDEEPGRVVRLHEITPLMNGADLDKHTKIEVTGGDSTTIAGEVKTYVEKFVASVKKNWHWQHPFDYYTALVSIECPAPYSKEKLYLYSPDKRSGDKELNEALNKALAECGLPPIPAGQKKVKLRFDIKVEER